MRRWFTADRDETGLKTFTAPESAPAAPEPLAPRRGAIGERAARLLQALQALDGVGLAGELLNARGMLARADELRRAGADTQGQAELEAERLAGAVADGSTGLDAAAAKLATLAPWLPAEGQGLTSGGRITDRAVALLRDCAVRAARDDAPGAHKALARQADAAVRAAVDAGALLVDVKGVARLLKAPEVPDPRVRPSGWEHPWVNNPPVMPKLDMQAIMRDGRLAVAWSAAAGATEQLETIKAAADQLCAATGGTVRVFPEDAIDPNVSAFVEQLPQPVHLALADALGWRPGLYWTPVARPSAPQVRTPSADWVAPEPVRWGPHAGWAPRARQS
ncbi:hypothetical protein ABT369_05370 [Dactylosporangium sp. NPDC000244]|uniref:hypothetical protein n=1 Tax=Dactylosporangium sp. NPDC000244 TaxID=3154365 RepID=UPI003332EBAF